MHAKYADTIRTVAALAVAALGIAGCSNSGNPIGPAVTNTPTEVKGEPALGPELAAVRAATAQFHDVDVAMAAGYNNPNGGVCDSSPAGTMGIHSGNPAFLGSQILDPTTPEVLLYLPKPGGGLKLVAVEYVQFVLVRNKMTGAVTPWGAPTPWPATHEIANPTPELFGQTFQGPMPGHVPGMPWHWDLHVWVWANNPSGMFAQWNPAVSCGG